MHDKGHPCGVLCGNDVVVLGLEEEEVDRSADRSCAVSCLSSWTPSSGSSGPPQPRTRTPRLRPCVSLSSSLLSVCCVEDDDDEPEVNRTPPRWWPTTDGVEAAKSEVHNLRMLVRQFVDEAIAGKQYELVLEGGFSQICTLVLLPSLRQLKLRMRDEAMHNIFLRDVRDVIPGPAPHAENRHMHLDQLCCTLLLQDSLCVTFRLKTVQECEDFVRCLGVLRSLWVDDIDGARAAAQAGKSPFQAGFSDAYGARGKAGRLAAADAGGGQAGGRPLGRTLLGHLHRVPEDRRPPQNLGDSTASPAREQARQRLQDLRAKARAAVDTAATGKVADSL